MGTKANADDFGFEMPRSRRKSSQRPARQGARQGLPQGKHPHKPGSAKRRVFAALSLLVVLMGALVVADFTLSDGKVHWGVKVDGVDIGGMTKADATTKLQAALDDKLANATVKVRPDAAAEERLAAKAVLPDGTTVAASAADTTASAYALGDVSAASAVYLPGISGWESAASTFRVADTAEADGSSISVQAENPEITGATISWNLTAADMGATVDAASLVDEAYAVGAVSSFWDFFPGLAARVNSWCGKVDLPAVASFDESKLASVLKTINDTIGVAMVNSDLAFDGQGIASVASGQAGLQVNVHQFSGLASDILLGQSTQPFTVPMQIVPVDISDQDAQKVATQVNTTLADPVTVAYDDHSWSLDASVLGGWITTSVEGTGSAKALVAQIDPVKAYDGIQQLMGDVGFGSAQNAQIDVSSGTPVIVGGVAGDGPDIKSAVDGLQGILFGDSTENRQVTCDTATVEPAVTAADIANLGIVELIASYKLDYGTKSGSDREFNIERCLDKLNGSLIAPGQDWNWNDVVGRCDDTTGYKDAGAIDGNNQVVQEPGGGICNVATCVFNAAYEAGLPILERANHSIYLSNYPLGRDAAVSWPSPTLSFANDTDSYIYVTASYDGSKMTISIWGTSPHRTVESKTSDWSNLLDGGKSITNYRTVKSADGSVWLQDTFYSYYPPVKDDTKPQDPTTPDATATTTSTPAATT